MIWEIVTISMIEYDTVLRWLFISHVARDAGWDLFCWGQLGGVCGSSHRKWAVTVQGHGGYLEGQGLRERVSSNSIVGW